jgi:cell division control protein 6
VSYAKDITSYQVASNLVAELSGEKPRGYDKKTVFNFLYETLQALGGTVIIVLDEIDSIG